jgi:hypothetical protein
MTEALFDPMRKAREQLRMLGLVPAPDEAFHAAAKSAMIHAGLPDDLIEFLDRCAREATPNAKPGPG